MTSAERRSAALLFGEELALGTVDPGALDVPEVEQAVRDRPVPSWVARRVQEAAVRRGSLTFEATSVAPMLAARRAVLGAGADGPPRLLVRVDGVADARFHEIVRAHEIPYLVAVTGDDPALLAMRHTDGVAFGLQATLEGDPDELTERIDRAEAALLRRGVLPDVFVPPHDRFGPSQYHLLAKRFAVITGGDQSVARFGWHPTPLWRGDAVYLPAYAPPSDLAAAVRRLAEQQAALWVPAVIAADLDLDDLVALCVQLRGLARPWDEFLAAVRASALAG